MRIESATIQDVPELQELQHKAFGPQCIELGWEDAPPMTESLEHAYEDFAQCTTLKVQDEEGRIIGSIRGHVTELRTSRTTNVSYTWEHYLLAASWG